MTIRVMVVDDQAMVRAGFSALLSAQPDIDVVAEAADGEEALRLAGETRPDIVLMDIRMPVLDGLEATRRLLETRPGTHHHPRVVMLTTFDADEYVYEALRVGASGFLLKDALPAELVAAVRVVAAGDALLAPSVTRRLIEEFVRTRGPSPSGSQSDRLTPRENEVLVLLARGSSNREIATILFVSEETVKTHVSRIFAKLALRDRAQAVVFAYETGVVKPS